jgi:hypothetical protein
MENGAEALLPGKKMMKVKKAEAACIYNCDILVIGAGVSGYCAAIQAAQDGCDVILLEKDSVLGGNSGPSVGVGTRGAHWFNDFAAETGVVHAIDEEIGWVHGKTPLSPGCDGFSISRRGEAVVQQFLEEAGVRILKMHYARSPIMEGQRIKAVECEDLAAYQSVLINVRHVVIEASGDGHIGALAGADFDMGTESRDEFGERSAPSKRTRNVQGSSLMALAYRADSERVFIPPPGIPSVKPRSFNGRVSSYVAWSKWNNFGAGKQLQCIYFTEAGGDRDTIRNDAAIYEELLKQMWAFWDFIKNGPSKEEAKNWDLIWISTKSGKRESRRFLGEYVLTQTDIEAGRVFPDDIAYGGHDLDEHQAKGSFGNIQCLSVPPMYGIPYRSCYSRNIENLFLAGRLISATHIAHSSPRVMRTGGAIGQAVGIAAAICREKGLAPREVGQHHLSELQNRLLLGDGTLLGRPLPPSGSDWESGVKVSATSELLFNEQEPGMLLPLYIPLGNILWDWPAELRGAEVWVENPGDRPEKTILAIHRSVSEVPWITMEAFKAHGWNDLHDPAFQKIAEYPVIVPLGHRGWLKIRFPKPLRIGPKDGCRDGDRLLVSLAANANLHWALAKHKWETAEVVEHREETACWHAFGEMAALRLNPPPRLGDVVNIIDGYHRRFSRGPTHMWMSNPAKPLPQDATLSWAKSRKISKVTITFDNLERLPSALPWECGKRVSEMLAKTYEIWGKAKSGWQLLAQNEENYHRFCSHSFKTSSLSAVRLRVLACHGESQEARVYAIRVE